jgi:general secretion pathway protein G
MKCDHSFKKRGTGRHAFTLVEMLLVVAIIGILAALIVPKISGKGEEARMKAAQADITSIGTALDMFEVDCGHYPYGKNGLADLLVQPRDAQNWKGPYLKDMTALPKDPWGHPYVYEFPGKHSLNSYDLTSTGPSGQYGNQDNIANWKK